MARIVTCPRCSSKMDAGNVAPGSSVRCPDCGALIRIATGNTSLRTKAVSPPAPAPAAPEPAPRARSSRGTEVRRGGTRVVRKGSNSGLIIGISVGAAVLVIVLVAAMAGKKDPKKESARKEDPGMASKGSASTPNPALFSPTTAVRPAETAGPAAMAEPRRAEDPSKVKWDDYMQQLRAGGGYDDPNRAEGKYFLRVKAMGKPAYPYIANYITHEEIPLGRAAVSLLNALTQRTEPLPNEPTKAKCKADWDAWIKANP